MFHTCNTHKTLHMYYRCGTTDHVCGDTESNSDPVNDWRALKNLHLGHAM